ncbi:MAG: HAD family phosphatase [Patescibacteria group bacterium]|nr:HAD family phosphatase [Patescibacteria group bacterium]
MSTTRRKLIIFDHDGVIANSEDLYDIADREFLRRHGVDYRREEIVSLLMGRNFTETTGILKERYQLRGTLEALIHERRGFLEAQYRSSLDFIPGFSGFHAELVKNGLQTCVATSSEPVLFAIAKERLRLEEFFGGRMFTVAQVGNRSKPNPALFLYAAEQMGVTPEGCMVIEDSPNGVLAAKNAAMYCVALTTTHTREQLAVADVAVSSYGELAQMMREVLSG